MDEPVQLVEGAESTAADHSTIHDLPDIGSFSTEERADWLKNGTPTEPTAKKAESPTAEEITKPVPTPESGTGSKQEQPKNAESRKAELNAEIRDLVAQRDRAKAELEGKDVKTVAKPSDAAPSKPVRPNLKAGDPGEFKGTWEEFQVAIAEYDTKLEAWLVAETERKTKATVEGEFATRQAKASRDAFLASGAEKHGAGFAGNVSMLESAMPEGLQVALSSMDDVAGLVAHLASKPEVLTALVTKFKTNAFAAVAELGRIEASLAKPEKSAPDKPQITKAPRPAADIAGSATASPDAIRAAIEAGDQETYNRLMNAKEMRETA